MYFYKLVPSQYIYVQPQLLGKHRFPMIVLLRNAVSIVSTFSDLFLQGPGEHYLKAFIMCKLGE